VGKVIGITGNIASGKSKTLDLLSARSYRILSSDEFIRDLYKSKEIQTEVLKIIPELEIFDRKKIAEIIYQQNDRRQALEAFIHPKLIDQIKIFSQSLSAEEIGFVEVPLLFEKDLGYLFDHIILICCNIITRIKRAGQRGISDIDFHKINDVQMPESAKIERADFVINSDVMMDDFENQIEDVIERIKCVK
jgi:dephospho-CoA kinase